MSIINRMIPEHSSLVALQAADRLSVQPKHPEIGALIGISRGNSYFTEQTIGLMTEATRESFASAAYMLPDGPSVNTLQALGLSHDQANKKSRLHFNRYEKMIRRIFDKLPGENQPETLRWNTVEKHQTYRTALHALDQLYCLNKDFRGDIDAESGRMLHFNLKNRFDKQEPSDHDHNLHHATLFLMKEFACILSSPYILNVSQSVYVYHRPMPVLKELLDGTYDRDPNERAGFLVYKEFPKEETSQIQ